MRRIAIVFFCLAGVMFGQTFEAASVRIAPPDDGRGVAHVDEDQSHINYRNVAVVSLLYKAFGNYRPWQIVGPNWLESQRYDISAAIPAGTTKDDLKLMFRHLLEERFGMKLHHEMREFKAWNLVVAKDGPKLRVSTPDAHASDKGGAIEDDSDGFPILNHKGMTTNYGRRKDGTPVARMVAKEMPISWLAQSLETELQALVIDRTDLKQTYDLRLEYTPFLMQREAGAEAELAAPGLVTAIKTLGLGVVETKAMQDVLVIDHIDKTPTDN